MSHVDGRNHASNWEVWCGRGISKLSAHSSPHGRFGSQTHKSIDAAVQEPDIFLYEGTYVDEDSAHSEGDVKRKALEAANKCKQLIVADFAPRDIFRFSTFHKIAKELVGKLLITKQDT